MTSTALTALLAACDEAVCEATDQEACPECEDEGEVLVDSSRYGSRLEPCPLWCPAGHRLYDAQDDYDRTKD